MQVRFENPLFDAQLLRALSHVYYGGADVGECQSTAQGIREGDFDSWYDAWWTTAERASRGATRRHPASGGVPGRPGAFGINTALTWSKDRVRLGVGDLGWFTRAAAGPEGSGFGRGRR